ncbi:wd domain-containing protein [Colletotrichum incanum]|uniref:Wd domain-containing protein n=1 Tax=Colletotrichum incanum TaxID=1573173 RepID=A0A162NBC0_COLIC|nr:wd domain-containing protein [Colletotrichum incanum]
MPPSAHAFCPKGFYLLFLILLRIVKFTSAYPVISEGDVLVNQPLDKRIKTSFPSFPDDYNGRIQRGKWLKELFPLNNEQAQEYNGGASIVSPFKYPDDMFDWGWTQEYLRWPFNPANEWPQFKDTLDEAFADPAFPVDKEKGIAYHATHERNFEFPDLRIGNPTDAHYTNVVNPSSGAFIFDSNFSPTYAQSINKQGDVPDLDTLSDFAYFQWWLGCETTNTLMTNLKLIFRSHIILPKTFDIVIQALRAEGHQGVPGWNERITFQMDSDPGLAILGTTHGASTAWMLLQHKYMLGIKAIKEVTVWGGDGGFSFDTPVKDTKLNLRFVVVDA